MSTLFATSTRADGPMGRNVAFTPEAAALRRRFLHAQAGVQAHEPVTTQNVHGIRVVVVSAKDAGAIIDDCDGLLTRTPNLPLVITH